MGFDIHHGTNVGGWLSQSRKRGLERREIFQQVDAERIAGWGMDHIRLPIDEEQMWDEQGNPQPEAWELLNAALDWCEAAGLRVVVDLHIIRMHHFLTGKESRLWTDPAAADEFADLWRDISGRLAGRSTDKVAYELLNEAVAADSEDWNRVSHHVIDALRELEPDRTLVLGSNNFNNVMTYDELRIPNDDNLMLTFHFYYPMPITHYHAGWTSTRCYAGPVKYPGVAIEEEDFRLAEEGPDKQELMSWNDYFDRDRMVEHLAQPLAARKRTGFGMFCGEFGCYTEAPLEARRNWYRDILDVFDEHDLGWSHWNYKGKGFGLVDADGKPADFADIIIDRA